MGPPRPCVVGPGSSAVALSGEVASLSGQVESGRSEVTTLSGQIPTGRSEVTTLSGQLVAGRSAVVRLSGGSATGPGGTAHPRSPRPLSRPVLSCPAGAAL